LAAAPSTAGRWSAAILPATVILAFAVRTAALSTYGFSEDEVAKLRAVEAYRHGEFSANAEHPMLMKLAIWASLSAADAWNALAPPGLALSSEAALRLPNVMAGTATVAAIYGIAMLLFGPAAAAAAGLIVALDPNVIALNRIGKEDTQLMCFFMLGIWAYEFAKRVGATNPVAAQRWYKWSGIGIGLMLASKYMPHFFGAYALFNVVAQRDPGENKPWKAPYYARIVFSFLVANFAILLPSTWAYCVAYLRGEHSVHHGYLYDGVLYRNVADNLWFGVPVTYYLHLFAVKIPLPVLAGAVIGLGLMVARPRERGFAWIRILFFPALVAYSLSGAKFQRYALPMLLMLDVLGAVGLAAAVTWIWRQTWPARVRVAACAAALALVAVPLLLAPLRAAPFYSAYQNEIGAALAPAVTVFPEEAYDFGVREAVREIAAAARPGAAVVSDASMVVEHYLAQYGRTDLRVQQLSRDGLSARGEQWVLVQDGHRSLENESLVAQLHQSASPWRTYRIDGTTVLDVFHLAR
jgi:4-amino-4-deoxy-L-arabinose transferase-like glycosyltransferase